MPSALKLFARHYVCLKVAQFDDEPIENVVNNIFTLNVNFLKFIECDNDVFTTEPKIGTDISNYLAR